MRRLRGKLNRRDFATAAFASVLLAPKNAHAQPGPFRPDQAFQLLKSLVGEWQGRTEGGRAVLVTYRLTANDTALVETWTMSPTRQSMTVYHMDGDALIATHYCPIGNQPRLEYRVDSSNERLHFTFRDATNLPDPNAAHQHQFWIRFHADGSFERNETYLENGEAASETLVFTRIPRPVHAP